MAEQIEQTRRLPPDLVEALTSARLFRLLVPRAFGGEEADPIIFVRVVEEIARADGAVGWCVALIGEYGTFGGYLSPEAAQEIYGSDPNVRTAGALRAAGTATVVEGGYRVTGRWQLGSGSEHASWIVGGCGIMDGNEPRLRPDGTPDSRILFFPAAECEIIDTWDSIGLRGTGSHDYAVNDLFVPFARSLSFRDPPVAPGPLYRMPTIALFGAVLAAVPLGIARHAIDVLTELAGVRGTRRSGGRALREDPTLQANLGHAEATLRSGRAFLYEALADAWQTVCAGDELTVPQRASLWLASTHAATAAKQAADMMFSVGGSASPYRSFGLERCIRDIRTAAQHLCLSVGNYSMAGQAFLGFDMHATPLLAVDDRSSGLAPAGIGARSESPERFPVRQRQRGRANP